MYFVKAMLPVLLIVSVFDASSFQTADSSEESAARSAALVYEEFKSLSNEEQLSCCPY